MESPQQIAAERLAQQISCSPLDASLPKNRTIEQKISQMAKSLANVAVFPDCKSVESLRQLQTQNSRFQRQSSTSHQQMMCDLNQIEESILKLERIVMMHHASNRIAQGQINDRIEDFEINLKHMADSFQQHLSQYGDKISDHKVHMVEVESGCKQKAQRLERDNRHRLTLIEKNIDSYQNKADPIKDHYLKKIKVLKTKIDEESREIEKQKSKMKVALSQLKKTVSGKIEEENIKQKQGFQQHYQTLQDIFRLLEAQVTTQ